MGETVYDAVVKFTGDLSSVDKELNKVPAKAGAAGGAAGGMFGGKFGSVLQGVGLGIGAAGFGLASLAIQGVIGFLGDAVKAAEDEQLSISGLTTALTANVAGWNGDTAGIEAYIAKAQDASAFTKDDLRNSLEKLVSVTHDVSKAEELQTTATNLARFSHTDLATATQTLVAVEAGRYRGLAALGINVKTVKTEQQALNDINTIAAGQDTAYLGTTAGQQEVLANKVHDLSVTIGNQLMPILEKVLGFVSDNLIPAFNVLGNVWDSVLNTLTAGGSHALAAYNAQQDAMAAAGAAAALAKAKSDALEEGQQNMHDENMAKDRNDALQAQQDAQAAADAAQFAAVTSQAANAQATLSSWGSFETQVTEQVTKTGKVATAAQIAAGKTFTKAVAGAYTPSAIDLNPVIIADSTKLKDLYVQLAKLEALRLAELGKGAYSQAAGTATDISTIIGQINAINAAAIHGGTGGVQKLAEGGAFAAGQAVMFGERGAEIGVFARPGYMLTHQEALSIAAGAPPGGAAGGGLTIGEQHIHGVAPDEVERQTLRALRRSALATSLAGGRT